MGRLPVNAAAALWSEWGPGALGAHTDAAGLLRKLPGPVWSRIPGRDRSRCRALTTLLHGNEPSGLRALLRYLASGATPAVDLLCLLGSVEAARRDPLFSQRVVPGGKDLNRCFREPFSGREGQVARECLGLLRAAKPEALIDLHNTSGRGPAYAVVTELDPAHDALAALFSRRMIVTDLRLGTLTEATTAWFPSVVVECGGAGDPKADEVAYKGLCRYADAETAGWSAASQLEVFQHPVRIELTPGHRVAFSDEPLAGMDVVLATDLDRFNFGTIAAGEPLGWVGERGVGALQLRSANRIGPADEFLTTRGDQLVATTAFRPLMITTRPEIAESDCLFYAIRAHAATPLI